MSADPSPVPEEPSDSARPTWRISDGVVSLDRPVVMGILNITPDSFSDGGELPDPDAALTRAKRMVRAGAQILDIGGESTRPGAQPVEAAGELARVIPVVEALASELSVPVSIDTRKAAVASGALAAGASIVNDVSALSADPSMGEVVSRAGAGVVLMHMRGTPADMREHARYDDVVGEVVAELRGAVARAERAGIPEENIVVDPGIGFAKDAGQSLLVLRRLERLSELGLPVLVGPSRKSFLGAVLGVPPHERVAGTIAACVLAYRAGARIFRVHDVEEVAQALEVAVAIDEGIRARART